MQGLWSILLHREICCKTVANWKVTMQVTSYIISSDKIMKQAWEEQCFHSCNVLGIMSIVYCLSIRLLSCFLQVLSLILSVIVKSWAIYLIWVLKSVLVTGEMSCAYTQRKVGALTLQECLLHVVWPMHRCTWKTQHITPQCLLLSVLLFWRNYYCIWVRLIYQFDNIFSRHFSSASRLSSSIIKRFLIESF